MSGPDPTAGERAACADWPRACQHAPAHDNGRLTPDPATPDAGDVEALVKWLHWAFHKAWNPDVALNLYADSDIWQEQARAVLASDWLAALLDAARREGGDERAEKIAQEADHRSNAAAVRELSDPNAYLRRTVWDAAARIAREVQP